MLDIASNRIKKIENVSHLTELQEFWVSLTPPLGCVEWGRGARWPGVPLPSGCGWSGWTQGLAVGGPRSRTSAPARMRSRQAPPQGEDGSEAVLPKWGFLCVPCEGRSVGLRCRDQVGPAGHLTTREAHEPATPQDAVSDQRAASEKEWPPIS